MKERLLLLKIISIFAKFVGNIRPKKSSLVSGNRPGENFFYHLTAHICQICMMIFIFCFKKTHTQTNKISQANLFVRIYVSSLQLTKVRALCFSTKKSAVRVVF